MLLHAAGSAPHFPLCAAGRLGARQIRPRHALEGMDVANRPAVNKCPREIDDPLRAACRLIPTASRDGPAGPARWRPILERPFSSSEVPAFGPVP